MADGTVYAVGDERVNKDSGGHNYGVRVYVRHRSTGYRTAYAHLNARLVNAGDAVRAGQQIGRADNTGNSFGSHLHLTLYRDGATGNGYPLGIVDPTPFLLPFLDSPVSIDLLPYLKGDGRAYMVKNATGGQEKMQTQTGIGTHFYQTKNSAWEELYYDAEHIYRDKDTSPGGSRFYRLIDITTVQPGSRWIPRHWSPGGEFTQTRRVQFYFKSNCTPSAENSGVVTDTMRFVARHGGYTFRTGITLPDVIELLWVNGGEKYFYARGFGLVGWERQHQDSTPAWSAISEVSASGSNVREGGCFS